jgi:hypothetical protein
VRFDELDQLYQSEQLKIVKTYRFEDESDSSDMAVIFQIIAMEKRNASLLMNMELTLILTILIRPIYQTRHD